VQNSAATIADTSGDITAGKYNGNTVTTGTGTLTLGTGSITISANSPINTGGGTGYINTVGGSGYINTSSELGFNGGHINTQGGTTAVGGYIRTHAGVLGTGVGAAGGNIDTSNGGGSIRTDYGGGSIDTRSVGQIELGVTGTRTTFYGSASGGDKFIALPNATGTIALTSDITGGTLAGSFTTLAGTSSATLGTNGGTGGSVVLRGSTSGSATISTSATGVLALPSGTTATSMALTTPALGVATATSVQVGNGTSSVTSLQIGNNALNGFYSPSLAGTDIGVSANGTWVAFWNSSWGLVARLPIIPNSNNGTSCGTSGLRWSGVYSVLGDFSGAVVCGTTLAVTGATTLTGLLTANGGITVVGGAKLLTTNTALTDNAGANTATLDNSPITGNPTKWIAINDNGTTRYIPTWS
jgi:hypothetical protein